MFIGAAAPLIGVAFSAAGQVAGMMSAGAQQRQQRAQAEAQVAHAQRVHRLEQQRFDYAYNAAEQQYLQEGVMIQEQSRQAREALEQAKIQQELTVQQQTAERGQVDAQMQSQVRQMLGNALATRTEASGANSQDLYELVSRLGEVRGGNDQLLQRLTTAMTKDSLQNNALDAASITDYQNTLDQAGTRQRMADIQGGAMERQAGTTSEYAALVDEYMGTVNDLQNRLTDYTLNLQPRLLDVQQQRNEAALSSARYANQAESAMGQNAANLNLQNTMTTARLMSAGGAGQMIGGILGTLGQVVPQVVSNWDTVFGRQQQAQSTFGTTPGFTTGSGGNLTNSGVYSFGGNGSRPAQGVPTHRSRNPYSGNTQRGYS